MWLPILRSPHWFNWPTEVSVMKLFRLLAVAVLFVASLASSLVAADIQLGATFACNGERIFVQSCNMQDCSDNGSCMIGHPDKVNANGADDLQLRHSRQPEKATADLQTAVDRGGCKGEQVPANKGREAGG